MSRGQWLRRSFTGNKSARMLGPVRTPVCPGRGTIIDLPAKEGLMTPNIADIIRQHVSLEVRCLDRLYLHAYLPKLQTLRRPVLLPARLPGPSDSVPGVAPAPATTRSSRRSNGSRTQPPRAGDPLRTRAPQRRRRGAATAPRFTAREGVVVIGVAQEKMRVVQSPQTPDRAGRSPSTSPASGSRSITTTSTSTTATGVPAFSRSAPTCRIP